MIKRSDLREGARVWLPELKEPEFDPCPAQRATLLSADASGSVTMLEVLESDRLEGDADGLVEMDPADLPDELEEWS